MSKTNHHPLAAADEYFNSLQDLNISSDDSVRNPTRDDVRFKLDFVERFNKNGSKVSERWTSDDVDMQIYLVVGGSNNVAGEGCWLVGYHGQEQVVRMNILMKAFKHQHRKNLVIISGNSYAKRGSRPIFRRFNLNFFSEAAAFSFEYTHNKILEEHMRKGQKESIKDDSAAACTNNEDEGVIKNEAVVIKDGSSSDEEDEYDCFAETQDPFDFD